MEKLNSIGKSIVRAEGPDKVTGKTLYTADKILPGMIWGKAVRSPIPHARILKVDVSRARSFPGVVAALTAKDVSDRLIGRRLRDMPILARDRVRFIGEKIAVIAAEDPNVAEEASALVEIEYEELPAVFGALAAIEEGAPLLHAELASYLNVPPSLPAIPNVHSHAQWRSGNTETGLAESDLIFEQTFTTPRVHQGYLETDAGVVALSPEGRVLIWSSNKVPYQIRQYLAEALGLDEPKILVQLSPVGGDFGGKGSLMDLPLCYYLAKATGRPVKMVMSYYEELTAGNPRHPSVITLKTGMKKDGRLWAREAKVVFNSGAYAGFKPNEMVNLPGARQGAGPYRIPNLKIDAFSVYTNCVPSGHMRGPGEPQMIFAVESHMDYLARELAIDPLEFRRMNILKRGDCLASGIRLENNKGEEILSALAAKSRWARSRRQKPYSGRGIAFCVKEINIGAANVEVGIEENGEVYILTTVPETGAGSHTVFRQIAGEALKISSEKINVKLGNTDSFDADIAVGGSRVTYLAGQAAYHAASSLRSRLLKAAADALHCSEDSVTISGEAGWGPGRRKVAFSELARDAEARGEPLKERARFTAKERTGTVSFFGQAAEVEVDPETGRLKILKVVTAHDVGTIINPVTHQGQIEGGLIQGFGFALLEDMPDEQGRIITSNLGEYKIPSIVDIPDNEAILVKDSGGPGPYQSKPIGESSISPTAPAIANAVYDAIGIQIKDLPVTAEKIYLALREKRAPAGKTQKR